MQILIAAQMQADKRAPVQTKLKVAVYDAATKDKMTRDLLAGYDVVLTTYQSVLYASPLKTSQPRLLFKYVTILVFLEADGLQIWNVMIKADLPEKCCQTYESYSGASQRKLHALAPEYSRNQSSFTKGAPLANMTLCPSCLILAQWQCFF